MGRCSRACLVLLILAGALALGGEPASANHPTEYCDPYDGRSTLIELTTPDGLTGFYIHDRSSVPGTGLLGVDEHGGGTWLYMESGEEPGHQNGASCPALSQCWEPGADPCPRQANHDHLIF